MASASRLVAAVLVVVAGACAAGCAGGPERVEGRIHYRAPETAKQKGTLLTIESRPGAAPADPAAPVTLPQGTTPVSVSPEELALVLGDLEAIGLFALAGRPVVPAPLPPGAIIVDTTARKFTVTVRDLVTNAEGQVFSKAARRIVEATQSGPRYTLPK